MPEFRYSSTLPFPVADVFAWHERVGAFERLTPGWERVEVLESEGGIRDGARVRLKMHRGPVALEWQIEHVDYRQDAQFVDVQRSGPFAHWRHEHRFSATPDGGTLMEDVIEWAPPLGSLGQLFAVPIVEGELRRGFAFRHRRLAHDLALHARFAASPRLKVAVSGSSGLIGRALCALLTTGGHEVVRIVRSPAGGGGERIHWNPATGVIDADAFAGIDAVVHLAGESIAGLRWTAAKKQVIRASRVHGTRLLAGAVAGAHDVKAFVMASAVGFYGDAGEAIVTEQSGPGRGFLAEVCEEWEAAAARAEGAGLRTVKVRNGLVLSPAGGALPQILRVFGAGLGGRLGSGRQYMPWIDLDDCVGIFHHALMQADVRGVLNATAPHPVTNAAFTDTLGRVLKRPTLLPAPSLAIRAALGEMGDQLLLKGQRARPEATLRAGYRFAYDDLESSLRHQLGRAD